MLVDLYCVYILRVNAARTKLLPVEDDPALDLEGLKTALCNSVLK